MSTKITLNQLIEELSGEAILSKTKSQEFFSFLIESILEDIHSKDKSTLTNFGSFTVIEVAERTGINPKTGESLSIPAHKRISFTPYKTLERKVNQDYNHLEAKIVHLPSNNENSPFQENKNVEIEKKNSSEELNNQKQVVENHGSLESDKDSNEVHLFQDLVEIEEELQTTKDDNEISKSKKEISFTSSTSSNRITSSVNDESPQKYLIIFLTVVVGFFALWFFFLPRQNQPVPPTSLNSTQDILNDPSAFENEQSINEVFDANQESTNEMTSQIIPMIAPEVDLSEIKDDVKTIENILPSTRSQSTSIPRFNVNAGIWIFEIARQTYGNTRLWPLIFEANYSLDNNPDLILPNIELVIPVLDGNAQNPSPTDYIKLANAARYVARAYERAGNMKQASAYFKAADWYETMP
jgi:nucleoid DNA-binding protein